MAIRNDCGLEARPEELRINRAWRSNLKAFREDWEAGEVSDLDLFAAVIFDAEPEYARECLEIIGEVAASKFDHWFTMHFGNQIPPRDDNWSYSLGPLRPYLQKGTGFWVGYADEINVRRMIPVFHRIVLDRREPL